MSRCKLVHALLPVCLGMCASGLGAQETALGKPVAVFGVSTPLYKVVDAELLDETLYVLTAPAPALHAFNVRTKSLLREWGASGKGPMELENPVALASQDGRLIVLERVPGANRLNVFTTAGDFLDSHRIPSNYAIATGFAPIQSGFVIGMGNFGGREVALLHYVPPDSRTLLTFTNVPYVRVTAPGGAIPSLGIYPPLGERFHWTTTADGQVAVWPAGGDSIELVSVAGDTTGAFPVSRKEIPVSQGDIDSWILRQFPPEGEAFGIKDPYRDLRKAARVQLEFPSHFPRVLALKPDPSGGVWMLRARQRKGDLWTLVTRSGAGASFRTPPGMEVMRFARDYVIGVRTDDLGVELVELYSRPDRE